MKRFLTLLALAAAAAAVFVSTRPSEFRIERSVMIDAPRPIVFGNLDDFRRWVAWSPWEKLDSAMQRTYDGPASGPGASYHWRGNSDVGEGRMTILASEPPLRLGHVLAPQDPRALELIRRTRAELPGARVANGCGTAQQQQHESVARNVRQHRAVPPPGTRSARSRLE